MNAAELTKDLLKRDVWKGFYQKWYCLSPVRKSIEQFTAMCIGIASQWFQSFLRDAYELQVSEMEWVAGVLIKNLKK